MFYQKMTFLKLAETLFTTNRNRIKLFRIKNTTVKSSPLHYLFGLHDIVIYTTDPSVSVITMKYIEDAIRLDDIINKKNGCQ